MPVYRVPFRLKFLTVSGHMIKCLLTEFGGTSGENIKLRVMKKGPRCAPYHSINKYTVFWFRTSHFYHSWCNWTWKMKSVILFSTGNVRFQCLPLWKVWFSSQDRPQYNLSLFFLTLSYLCVIMDSLSSWTFHFLAGVICMIKAKTTKKAKWL